MTDERDLCKGLRAKRLAVWLRQLLLGDIRTDAMLEAAAREGEVGDGLRRRGSLPGGGAERDDGTAGDKADRWPRA
jgi:hypothetical protein